MKATTNPFNITKAVDFSDQEINDYWVDIPGAGFTAMAKPTSPMPMLILGGKGSGKTHLMRYFSYPLQRIRHGRDVIGGIQKDKYLGIYLRCGGLNSARFRSKGQSDETWAEVFAYYIELWLAQLSLSTIQSAVSGSGELEDREPEIVAELAALINLRERPAPNSLTELGALLRELQQELDDAVNNSSITRTLPVHIAITRGELVFGIPKVVAANLPCLRDCLFLYLIDEFENLSDSQQKYVNTLLRERQSPSTFKIGAKMYGVRTYSTYSAEEENKEGSEYEVLPLDKILRENRQYADFAKLLISKRLAEFNGVASDDVTLRAIADTLSSSFEEPPKSRFSSHETAYILEKYKGRERPYFKALRQHLEAGMRSGAAPGVEASTDVEGIISSLSSPDFPLLEKLNIYLLYKEWGSGRSLLEAARAIAEECRLHIGRTGERGRYKRTLLHFKSDLLAQLYRETDQRQKYVGLKAFIEMSCGLPRNLLILLKHVFSWATFNGERPFRGEPISIRSQQAGVLEAADWFHRDARMLGRDGELVIDSVNRLGTLFRGIRFSAKPSECSCATFSSDVGRATSTARRVLDLAEKWSLLIDVGDQRDRNTDRIDAKYQLNRMLAPKWDLAIYRRGVVALSTDELNSVFDPECAGVFEKLADLRVARMTAPFFGRRTKIQPEPATAQVPQLFSNQTHD